MTDESPVRREPSPSAATVPGVSRLELSSVAFAVSGGMLAYEILLTRVASVLLTSDHLFLVLGLALLGMALGAIIEYFIALRPEPRLTVMPGFWLIGNGVVVVAAIIALVTLGPGGGVAVLAVAAALPFAVAGLIFSRLFRIVPELTGSLYAADLLGAATGALLVPATLAALGPVQAILLFAAAQTALGAMLLIRQGTGVRLVVAVSAAVFAAGVVALNRGDQLLGPIPVGRSLDKDLFRLSASAVGGVETIDSRWSTFGRTDLVRFASDPNQMLIFIDGAAGTPMFQFDGDLGAQSATLRSVNRGFAGALPLALLRADQKDRALIIGPGGGRDVLVALQAGFKRITAVEVNPQMVEIVRDYRAFNGGLYTTFPNVDVITDEGRRYLRASTDRYDLIALFMPITKSSRGLNVFALSESYLFTKEAFRDYHRHLDDDGMLLIMAHGMEEAVKLVTTAVEALQDDGLSVHDAMDHLYVLGSHMMPLFVLTKRPPDADQNDQMHALAHAPTFDPQYSYIPGVTQEWVPPPASARATGDVPMMNPLLYDLADGSVSLGQVERRLGLNLVPATDDRPFFSQFGFGPPALVLTMLWVSLAALLAAVTMPGTRRRPRSTTLQHRPDPWVRLWFAGIGAGFIVVELVLLQKLMFYLGDPSRSLALLLASLLVGSGAGSLISTRMRDTGAVLAGALSAAGAVVIAWILPVIYPALQTASLGAKLAVASALLVAQGVPMGMMFPIGLRVAGRRFGPAAVPWMWAINGAASVVGSALAIIVAMAYGYSWSLGVGVVCYVLAAVAAWSVTRRPDTATGTPVARNLAHTNSQRTSRARRALPGLWGPARPGHRGASRVPGCGG